jgi:hypothetical protein
LPWEESFIIVEEVAPGPYVLQRLMVACSPIHRMPISCANTTSDVLI